MNFVPMAYERDAQGDPTIALDRVDVIPKAEREKWWCPLIEGGLLVGSLGYTVRDAFNGEGSQVPLSIFTDGEKVWPAEVVYYLDRWGVRLPKELEDYLVANEFRLTKPEPHPELSREAIEAAGEWVGPQIPAATTVQEAGVVF